MITGLADDAGAAIPAGGSTVNAHPTVSGTAKAGDIVTLFDGSTAIGSAKVGTDGKWSIKPSKDLSVGSHDVYAIDTNLAGTPSAQSTHVAFTVTSAFAAPVILNVVDAVGPVQGTVAAGGVTDDPRPTVSGTGIPGDTVYLYQNGYGCGDTKVGADGKWSIRLNSALSEGAHDFTATQFAAGQAQSAASNHWSITVDTSTPKTPAAPTLTDDSGASIPAGSTTNDGHPYINGSGKAGDTITVYDGSTVLGTAMVGVDGKWTFKPSGDLSTGAHSISVTDTNPAGTVSPKSGSISFTISHAPTETVTVTGLYDDTSGSLVLVSPGGSTRDTTPIVKGTVDHSLLTGESLVVYRDGVKVGAATMNGTSWSFNDSGVGVGGSHSYTARVENSVGNSAFSAAYSFNFNSSPVYPDGLYYLKNNTPYAQGNADDIGPYVLRGSSSAPDGTKVTIQIHYYLSDNNMTSGDSVVTATVSGGQYSLIISSNSKNDSGGPLIRPYTGGSYNYAFSIYYPGPLVVVYTKSLGSYYGATRDIPAVMDENAHAVTLATDAANATLDKPTDTLTTATHTSDSPTTVAPIVVHAHEAFKGTTGHDIVDLNVDPTAYFKESTAHIEGSTVHPADATTGADTAVNTLHLTGDHQVLDLTSLTGQTAAAKISGIEVIDLGGQHNTLKLSLVDVLNLGEADLFMKDGKQQMMVQGKEGDEVDLSNSHIAGVADGQWEAHGTAQVGGVTYNVYEHSGAHSELLVQQGVQIVVH